MFSLNTLVEAMPEPTPTGRLPLFRNAENPSIINPSPMGMIFTPFGKLKMLPCQAPCVRTYIRRKLFPKMFVFAIVITLEVDPAAPVSTIALPSPTASLLPESAPASTLFSISASFRFSAVISPPPQHTELSSQNDPGGNTKSPSHEPNAFIMNAR